jgi:hypothetical protein
VALLDVNALVALAHERLCGLGYVSDHGEWLRTGVVQPNRAASYGCDQEHAFGSI